MRRIVVVSLLLLAGCTGSGSNDGSGHLDMADLRASPALQARFAGAAQPVRGSVRLAPNGCFNVLVDGVERHPIWPEGTTATADRVELPGGEVTLGDGDTFTASGVYAAAGGPSAAAGGALAGDGKAESLLAFCAVAAPPVAFPDAATFAKQPVKG